MATKNNPGKFDCYANAEPDEPMFVLLGRDPAAPEAILQWASERVRARKNEGGDEQLVEALECAAAMAHYRRQRDARKPDVNARTEPPPGFLLYQARDKDLGLVWCWAFGDDGDHMMMGTDRHRVIRRCWVIYDEIDRLRKQKGLVTPLQGAPSLADLVGGEDVCRVHGCRGNWNRCQQYGCSVAKGERSVSDKEHEELAIQTFAAIGRDRTKTRLRCDECGALSPVVEGDQQAAFDLAHDQGWSVRGRPGRHDLCPECRKRGDEDASPKASEDQEPGVTGCKHPGRQCLMVGAPSGQSGGVLKTWYWCPECGAIASNSDLWVIPRSTTRKQFGLPEPEPT